ncbi:hypothetical protein EJB05_28397, partial [Eragrostis curvula]
MDQRWNAVTGAAVGCRQSPRQRSSPSAHASSSSLTRGNRVPAIGDSAGRPTVTHDLLPAAHSLHHPDRAPLREQYDQIKLFKVNASIFIDMENLLLPSQQVFQHEQKGAVGSGAASDEQGRGSADTNSSNSSRSFDNKVEEQSVVIYSSALNFFDNKGCFENVRNFIDINIIYNDYNGINLSEIMTEQCIAKIGANDSALTVAHHRTEALEDVTALFYDEDMREVYTGNKHGPVH